MAKLANALAVLSSTAGDEEIEVRISVGHMWVHRRKQYVCEVCGCAVTSQQGLDEHRHAMHPGENRHICFQCGKSFVSRQGLWEHGRVHGRGPPGVFHCQQCSKQFTSRQGFLIHNRTHTGERPYGCKFCTKAFRDGGTLRKHERIHTGERPHACPLCHRAFNQKVIKKVHSVAKSWRETATSHGKRHALFSDTKVVLREHVRWVHAANKSNNDVPHIFSCQLCGQTLGDREELCAHIVQHSDQMAAAAKALTASSVENPNIIKKELGAKMVTSETTPPSSTEMCADMTAQASSATDSYITSKYLVPNGVITINKPEGGVISSRIKMEARDYVCDMCGEGFALKEVKSGSEAAMIRHSSQMTAAKLGSCQSTSSPKRFQLGRGLSHLNDPFME
uniref:C2H2-type domain-containing protein n=1 Tax=Timema genevievae TaxID=629358 RepID=A0A7R9K7X1_TIMGE|nr:unnamed protein product [Timema genevievae]